MYNRPLAYFITFRTYGTWLHGDERGSFDRVQNRFGAVPIAPSEKLQHFERDNLAQEAIILSDTQRVVVTQAIRGVCSYRGWELLAQNVRTNHVHAVIAADAKPERIMNSLKSWSTRRLREAGLVAADARVWSRHGSTVYLFAPEKVAEKINYVLHRQ